MTIAVLLGVDLFFLAIAMVVIGCGLDDLKKTTKRLETLERARQIFCQDLFERLRDDLENRTEEK